LWILYRSLIKT